ncbi:MAG: response regulator transcription factor [Bacillota bacterium]
MSQPARVLVVEDEARISRVLEHLLRREGYQVLPARDGEEALERASGDLDLVLLDLGLPKLDGFEVCRRIKAQRDLPIIVLSARSDESDRIMGLTLGADDYVTKPFSPAELVLRVKAVLRRAVQARASAARDQPERVERGKLHLDRSRREVQVGDRPVSLTGKEFDLLWIMAQRPGQVWTREKLLERVWDTDYTGDSATLTVLIRRLREKIEDNPAEPQFIRTVYGVGYRFVEPPSC